MKVITKDFQRLKGENTFEFPVGVTIIQGKTGSGKTSLFYAVEDCLSNPSGVSDVINWDAKFCEVTIENGGYVDWIKTNTSSEYRDKTGKPYVKASKLDSRDIDDLGFYFDRNDNIVNIHNENSLLFPFSLSDTEMFKLFEDIFNISSSFQIIDLIKKDEQDLKNQLSGIKSQIDNTTIQNNSIDSILSQVDINKVNNLIQDIKYKEEFVSNISKDYVILSNTQHYINLNLPEILDTNIFELSNRYNELVKDYNDYISNMRKLEWNLPSLKEFTFKENIYKEEFINYSNIIKQLDEYSKILFKLDEEEEQVREKLKEIKVCPTCGQSLEGIHV